MRTEPRIVTTWVDPPFPNGGRWQAHDDRLGADTSPIGTGRSEQEAIDDLLARGDPSSMTAHAFSLASKLAALDVGDVILLPDDAPMMSATQMERQVTNVSAKSRLLTGRKFRTSRCDTVTQRRTLLHTLLVERTV